MTAVVLVEDDPAVRRGVTLGLQRLGHIVEAVGDGLDAIDTIRASQPEIVILDLMLPGINGLELCRRIRAEGTLPVIILSARDLDMDIVLGFDAGADDYCVKPASAEVIDARIRAVLRRATPSLDAAREPLITFGEITLDRSALRVTRGHQDVPLTPTEMRLLLFFADHLDQTVSRQELLEQVWEQSYYGEVRLVDACVKRLRAKIEPNAGPPRHLQTVRGFGYRFTP